MTPAISRRTLIGSSAAMLLAGAFEAGATKAAELDRDLIEASREYFALEAEFIRIGHLEGEVPLSEGDELIAQGDALLEQQEAIRAAMVAAAARTPEGLRAKAAVLRDWLQSNYERTEPGCSNDWLAWSLCNDLLGRS